MSVTPDIFKYVDVALQDTYDALTPDDNTMYGIQETQRVYFGSNLLADKNVIFSSTKPSTAGTDGLLYVVTSGNDKGAYIYNSTASAYEAISLPFSSFTTTTVRAAASATDTVVPTEAAVRTALDLKADQATTYTKTEVDGLFTQFESDLDWKEAVANYAAIATTYPNPEDGWTVSTKDTNNVYRYDADANDGAGAWINVFTANTNEVEASTSGTGGHSGLMTAAMAEKLAGVATGAEVNQNAFSTIKIGSTNITADAKTDTIEFVAGTNITFTDSSSGTDQKITISGPASYTHPAIASGVTAGTNYNKVSFDSTGHVATASAETTMSGLGVEGTTADITSMSSYAIASAKAALATTDTLNQGLGKLEYRIKAQEDALVQTITSSSTAAQIASAKAIYDTLVVTHI